MTTNLTITTLECVVNQQLGNIVNSVSWKLEGTQGEHTVELTGILGLEPPSNNNFTPFAELDKDTVVSWIEDRLNVGELTQKLQAELTIKSTPTKIIIEPDWG